MTTRNYSILDVLKFQAKMGKKAGKIYGHKTPNTETRLAAWAATKLKFCGIADDQELHPFLLPVYVSAYKKAADADAYEALEHLEKLRRDTDSRIKQLTLDIKNLM